MSLLPIHELILFAVAVVMYLAASVVGVLQLRAGGEKYRRLLLPVVCAAIVCEAIVLIFRAVEIRGIPLTGLFESMIVLTAVFGLIYIFFSLTIRQVWFGSVMVWVISGLILLAAVVAKPASELRTAAATPWAIAHGIAFILGGASIAFATASAFLYLLSRRRLKQKKAMQVFGKVPNMEKLEHMNTLGIKVGLLLLTIGLVSGIGMVVAKTASLNMALSDWLKDPKIVLVTATWAILAVILVLRRAAAMKPKTTAYITMVAFVLILFSLVGVTVFCGTKHDFTAAGAETVELNE